MSMPTRPLPLPEGTLLDGRYVLGAVLRQTDAGIIYTAFDKKLRMMAEVLEFLPEGTTRQTDGSVTGDSNFIRLRDNIYKDALKNARQTDSNIYDTMLVAGTVFLVHISQNTENGDTPSAGPLVLSVDPAMTPATTGQDTETPTSMAADDVVSTKIVEGLFSRETDAVNQSKTTVHTEEKRAAPPSENPKVPSHNRKSEDAKKVGLSQVPSSATTSKKTAVQTSGTSSKTRHTSEDEEETPNTKLLLIVLCAGILLLLLCCGIFFATLLDIADKPEDISLIGIPYTEIATVTKEPYMIVGRGLHENYAPGMIITEKESENGLLLTVNGQSATYVMPDLLGMTPEGASALLNRTDLLGQAGQVTGQITLQWEKTIQYPHGSVIAQSPAAGSISKSSSVTLTIADNELSMAASSLSPMPDFVGQNWAASLSGYPLVISDKIYSSQPEGEILYQYPCAGSSWGKGTPCYVVVSLGPESTTVPDVQFLSVSEAEAQLYGCGLSFTIEYQYSSTVMAGLVIKTEPAAQTELNYGDSVTLICSGSGTWNKGPVIQTEQSQVVLAVGDTCTMGLENGSQVVYHSSAPGVVSVTPDGTVTALAAGSAAITASAGGNTVVMYLQVSYDNRSPYISSITIGEKQSLPGLGGTSAANTVWYYDDDMVTITEDGILTGKTVGETVIIGSSAGKISLYKVTIKEEEKKPVYVTISKSLTSDVEKMKAALIAAGLTCEIEEIQYERPAGTMLRIKYTGYSDDESYYFTAKSRVVLVVSKGMPSVTSISIADKPNKLTYTVGEKLDTTGLTLMITYEDNSTAIISRGYTVSYDFSTAGQKTVSVSYSQQKTSFTVKVESAGPVKATLLSLPNKLSYMPGEMLDTTGMQLQITYGDGSTKTYTTGFTTKYTFATPGTSRVTVSMEGVSTYFDVTVTERKVQTISVKTPPHKILYTVGEPLDTTGMEILITYSDGYTETIRSGWTATCDLKTAGEKKVTVTYQTQKTSYSIVVSEISVSAIAVQQQPYKSTYYLGEEIDLTGLVLSITHSNGDTSTISYPDDGITYDTQITRVGEGKLILYYGGQSTTTTIYIAEAMVTGIEVLALPAKLNYKTGEILDTTGLTLLVTYSDGKIERVTSGYHTVYDFSKIGTAIVTVYYKDKSTVFTVTVEDNTIILVLSEESIYLGMGETVELKIFYTGNAANLSYTSTSADVLRVVRSENGLLLTGLAPGKSTIVISDGIHTATCTVSVEKVNAQVTAEMSINHQTDSVFMPVLVFKSNGISVDNMTFTATITYDPEKLQLLDTAGMMEGVTITQTQRGLVTITGTITVPGTQAVNAAYLIFHGTDTSAYSFKLS